MGTSLGGYWAARTASKLGRNFVAINPCVNPRTSLAKYKAMPQSSLESYDSEFADGNRTLGLILLDETDEVLDSAATQERFKDRFPVIMYKGGNHRFAHIHEALSEIEAFAIRSIMHK